MKKKTFAWLFGGLFLLFLQSPAMAQVQRVELDIAGYLCGF